MLKSPSQRLWLVALLATITLILFDGYTFNSNDQEEHLPQVYQLINPALYHFDTFVTAYHQTFSPRLVFVWLFYLLHFILPIPAAVFIFYVACITVTIWSLLQLALYFYNNNLFAQSSVFAILLLFNEYIIGGNSLMNQQLMCSTFAIAFCSLALYFALRKSWMKVAVFTGIATLFQVLVGLHFALLLSALFVLTYRNNLPLKIFIKNFILYLVVASPMLFPLVAVHSKHYSPDETALFYHVLFYVRNPNHYLPSSFPLEDYIHFISLTVFACIIHFFVDERLKKCWRWIVFILGGGMMVYTLLLEGIGFMPIGKIQWFKVCYMVTVMDIMVIVYFIINRFNEKIKSIKLPSFSAYWMVGFMIAGLVLITNSRYIPVKYFQNRYHVGNYIKGDYEKMHDWIRLNTPVDCVILTHPYDDSFLCEAQRNMPVGWKAIVHEPFYINPWYKSFILAFHNNEPFKGYDVRRQATLYYYANPPLPTAQLYWDFRIADLKKGKIIPQAETIVHRENDIVLVKVL